LKTIIGIIQLLRPLNIFLGIISVIISYLILKSSESITALLQGCLTVAFLASAANALNDFCDYQSDTINHPDRPLPLNLISKQMALLISIILFITGNFIAFFININAFIISAGIATPAMIAYNIWLKGTPLLGNIIVSTILGLAFIFSGACFNQMLGMTIPALLAFGFNVTREFVKDIADIAGDKKEKMRTFPVIFGIKTSLIIAKLLIILTGIGTLLPYWFDVYGKNYLFTVILGVEIPLLYSLFSLMESPSILTCKSISHLLKICVIFGLLAIYLG